MRLSQEQLREFEDNGFLLLKGFATKKRCAQILAKAKDEIVTRMPPIETEGEYNHTDNTSLRRLRQVYGRDELFARWMREPSMREILVQVLKDEPILTLAHHNSIMTKMPYRSTETCWHQDKRYWSFQNDNLVSVWLALDDEYADNGVLKFIPKSHKMVFGKESFDERDCFCPKERKNMELIDSSVQFDLSAGDVVLFHCNTLHYATENLTDKPKISFVYTVRGRDNLPIDGTRSASFSEIAL